MVSFGVSHGPCPVKVIRKLGGLCLQPSGVDPLDAVGDAKVQALAAGQGQRLGKCLADQLVDKTIPRIPHIAFRNDEVGSLGFFNGVEDGFGIAAFQFLQEAQTEAAANDRRDRQDAACVFAQPVQPSSHHQPDAFRHLEPFDVEIGKPFAIAVEELSFLGEMPEHFFHKEWIALGLVEDDLPQRRRRGLSAHGRQHFRDAALGQALEAHASRLLFAEQPFQGAGKRARYLQFHIAVGADHQQRSGRQRLGMVLQKQQGSAHRPNGGLRKQSPAA